MGEATYYMKARFPSEETAQQAAVKTIAFFQRVNLCADEWQKVRHGGEAADKALREKYPDVFAGLKLGPPKEYDAAMNYLAGQLDAPPDPEECVSVDGDEIRFWGTVWHFADWDGFVMWLKEECGAEVAAYVSDEYLDPFDSITLD